ncbi:MAG: STAS domain-containing protein [Halarcobacter sp.]
MDVENKDTKILKINGSLFFGTASILDRKIDKINPNTKFVILDCLHVSMMDLSAIFILEEIIVKLEEKNIKVILLLNHTHRRKVLKIDTNEIFSNTLIFNNIDAAVNAIQKNEYKKFSKK